MINIWSPYTNYHTPLPSADGDEAPLDKPSPDDEKQTTPPENIDRQDDQEPGEPS